MKFNFNTKFISNTKFNLSKWIKKKLNDLMYFSLSATFMAIILYFVLPYLLSSTSRLYTKNNDIQNSTINKEKLTQEIQKYMNDSKTKLIFRTQTDLVDILKVPRADLILHQVSNKTWQDTSLECFIPLHGKPISKQPQLLKIQGWIIIWKFKDTLYRYHTSVKGDWVLCSKIEIPAERQ